MPLDSDVAGVVSRIGLALQGLCFALALAHRSRLIERENTTIREKYTRQLEQELARRTQQLREQDRVMEEQRFHQLQLTCEHKQAETGMAALRAQMNPHFIFNCLDSIKLYLLIQPYVENAIRHGLMHKAEGG